MLKNEMAENETCMYLKTKPWMQIIQKSQVKNQHDIVLLIIKLVSVQKTALNKCHLQFGKEGKLMPYEEVGKSYDHLQL